ncbi:hypothetical protein MZD04_gp368 [Pseudomonas phage Psa21]|uniref:Uncharacterized protein n=1 Tax=Pseudomonas phage Psa21 TaxID=2530023 RepID=A0A481W6L3_9CAUD|nr:hypothetical protein MZD04_gp368 [Pseudomonas phage Psa21]QBJ02894.1 hypothetical protein PSA21_368 [Pseudomonas phage Psa21]
MTGPNDEQMVIAKKGDVLELVVDAGEVYEVKTSSGVFFYTHRDKVILAS